MGQARECYVEFQVAGYAENQRGFTRGDSWLISLDYNTRNCLIFDSGLRYVVQGYGLSPFTVQA